MSIAVRIYDPQDSTKFIYEGLDDEAWQQVEPGAYIAVRIPHGEFYKDSSCVYYSPDSYGAVEVLENSSEWIDSFTIGPPQ